MSQVMRYTPSLKPGLMIEDAEGKWAKYEVLAQVVAQVGALQALLTAADERADVLERFLRQFQEVAHGGFLDDDHVRRVRRDIDAALKTAEGGGDDA